MTARPKATHFVVMSHKCSRLHSCHFSLGWCTSANDRLFSSMQRTGWVLPQWLGSLIRDADEEDAQIMGIAEDEAGDYRCWIMSNKWISEHKEPHFDRGAVVPSFTSALFFTLHLRYVLQVNETDWLWRGWICSGNSSRKGGLKGWKHCSGDLATHCTTDWLSLQSLSSPDRQSSPDRIADLYCNIRFFWLCCHNWRYYLACFKGEFLITNGVENILLDDEYFYFVLFLSHFFSDVNFTTASVFPSGLQSVRLLPDGPEWHRGGLRWGNAALPRS